jgi:tetratricopeptide (TPR) repeat protein
VQNGDYQQAVEAMQTYLTYEKGDANAYNALGQALYATGQYSDTLSALNQAIQLNKTLADAYHTRGLVEMRLDQGSKAVNDIYIAMQNQPRSVAINVDFAQALLAAGRLGDSLGQINLAYDLADGDKSDKKDAEMAQVLFLRAQILERIGNIPTALKDWKKLLGLPEEAVTTEMKAMAEKHLAATVTPLPTATPTPTITPTPFTPTSTKTVMPSKTVPSSKTPTPTKTLAPTKSPTPSKTPLPSKTATAGTLAASQTPTASIATVTQTATPIPTH